MKQVNHPVFLPLCLLVGSLLFGLVGSILAFRAVNDDDFVLALGSVLMCLVGIGLGLGTTRKSRRNLHVLQLDSSHPKAVPLVCDIACLGIVSVFVNTVGAIVCVVAIFVNNWGTTKLN
jgi:uncharacterized membrane protein YiaA